MKYFITFTELPLEDVGLSKLFLHYVTQYNLLNDFYNGNFQDTADWQKIISLVGNRHINRTKLVQILLSQNRDFQCGVKTLANIDLLLNDNTFAIITGQQVGFFGGPLYTLYKTVTAIQLAETLSNKYPDYNFVPIFWLESEDHDYQEVSALSIINKSNELFTLSYENQLIRSTKNAPVGNIKIDESIKSVFESLSSQLIATEFTPKIMELFSTAYMPGTTFTKAFVYLFNVLLEDSGLIFFDPSDIQSKQLLQPVFEYELGNISKTSQLLITQSDTLEQHYHAQVKPRAVNLFFYYNNGRYAIEPKENGFFLKGTRQKFKTEEMMDFVKTRPDLFSPNVVLRPICQDTLFPTVAYVAGPSEIAYFAQLKLIYEDFKIPMPIIYPRASITILEERPLEIIKKYGLELKELFQEKELIKKKVITRISDINIDEIFSGVESNVKGNIETLKNTLERIDPTLIPALNHTVQRIEHSIHILKNKTDAAHQRLNDTAIRQLERVYTLVYPGSQLQERKLNILYFMNKYGPEFTRWLYNEMSFDVFQHQVIVL